MSLSAPTQALRDILQEISSQAHPFVQTADWLPCTDPRHGDYQCNTAMPLAKCLGKNPREIATAAADIWNSRHAKTWGTLHVAGAGFLNWSLSGELLAGIARSRLRQPITDPVPQAEQRVFVLDYSGPNVAKAMHVGHIRSTVLGDCLARVLRARGHRVITDNHIGDWGTQFGKLILGWKTEGDAAALDTDPITEMERLYKITHERCQHDLAALEQARRELLLLQQGDTENTRLWKLFRTKSQIAFDRIYQRLGITFDYTLGESYYQHTLAEVVNDLRQRGIAQLSEGAVCVFFPDHPQLADKPFLIEKSDGAALYATTDLATIKYRMENFSPHEVWYVTDARQSLHFMQLFETARRWGITATLRHVAFGAILGPDKKPLKTREGNPIKLENLLDEAVNRARAILEQRATLNSANDSSAHQTDNNMIAEALGIGAVKYADLAQNRHLDYVFDWNKMLALDGNTAPYIINAHVRCASILRKAGHLPDSEDLTPLTTQDTQNQGDPERSLLLLLTRWHTVLEQVILEQRPHHLCFHLYELAGAFHRFFEHCPVLKAETQTRARRLALCLAIKNTLAEGLELLGIVPLEKM